MAFFSFFACSKNNNFTESETVILNKTNFSKDIAAELKGESKNSIFQLPAIDPEKSEIINDKTFDGIYSKTTKEKAENIVRNLKENFKKKGYLVFYSENEKDYIICVIKGNDELDILKYRRTNAINYDLESKDLIKKIKEWQGKYGLNIIGCDFDYIHIDFEKLPENIDEFAKEVYAFCPDSVDQGVGSIESLKEYILQEQGVWLWWD